MALKNSDRFRMLKRHCFGIGGSLSLPDISLRRVDQSTAKPKLIVIFVHGLGGDPVSTWCHTGGEADGYFWPRGIAEKIEGCAVFTLGYPADKAVWNTGWPIATAAVSVLDKLMSSQRLRECGDVPIAFVCHSLGGLIIKKLVVTAHLDRQQQPAKGEFLDRIAGVVFLATPHSGSIIANIVSTAHWFVTNSLTDLKASDANLLDLSHSYRERIINGEARIRHRVYYETEAYGVFKIVSPASADLGVPGARPIGVKRHHMSICKPLDEEDRVYEGVLTFLQDEVLLPRAPSQNDKIDELLRLVSQKESVPLETLRAILAEMGEAAESADAGQIAEKLSTKAEEFKSLTKRLNRLTNADPEITRLRKTAAVELTKGRFAKADALLAEAEVRDLSGLEELESLAHQKRLSAAESRAERASAAQLRMNPDGYREAAEHYGEAARIAIVADSGIARAYTMQKGLLLTGLGAGFGLNSALIEAIDHFRGMLRVTDSSLDAQDWAATQNNLGNALSSLGEREGELLRLEEACIAYNLALSVYRADCQTLEWAEVQNNLGVALRLISLNESSTVRLEEAVVAHRAALGALKIATQDTSPLSRGRTHNNLGIALQALDTRERDTARLEESVQEFGLALKEFQREQAPLYWATTQHNLAISLQKLGERDNGTTRLEEAIIAYGLSLEERTRERTPVDWTLSFGNQGLAMMTIAKRKSDLALAKRAAAQIEEALQAAKAAGHGPLAAFYDWELLAALALVMKLGG